MPIVRLFSWRYFLILVTLKLLSVVFVGQFDHVLFQHGNRHPETVYTGCGEYVAGDESERLSVDNRHPA